MYTRYSFPGGIHPHEGKGGKITTSILQTIPLKAPDKVTIPLKQHIGAPCKCLVKKGELVKVGQMIGEAEGYVSTSIHSSVSGKVIACQPCLLQDGSMIPSVTIENDFNDDWVECVPKENPEQMTIKELAEYARNMGLVGLGGATFPMSVKLNVPENKKIDTLLLNGAECEPYLSADHRLMLEKGEEMIKGAKLIQNVLGIKRVIVGIEENKPDAIKHLTEMTNNDSSISIVPLKVQYPQGGEKQLIYATTKRKVKMGGLPLDIGVIVSNVASCYALYQAVYEGRPLIERIVTVGGLFNNPQNFLVRIGTSVNSLIESVEGKQEDANLLIMGGPMMGTALNTTDIPVTKGCSGILALEATELLASKEDACIRCGRCVANCPVNLSPSIIDAYMRKNMFEETEQAEVMNCMSCGICSWSCPAKRELTQSMNVCKQVISERRRAAAVKKG